MTPRKASVRKIDKENLENLNDKSPNSELKFEEGSFVRTKDKTFFSKIETTNWSFKTDTIAENFTDRIAR